MSDTLSWTAPTFLAFGAGSNATALSAIATVIAADPNWEVNASGSDWLEIKPSAGPYVNDRFVIRYGAATTAANMASGNTATVDALLCAGAPGQGGSGPTWPNGATGEPYNGNVWTKFVQFRTATLDESSLVLMSSRDGLLIALSNGSSYTSVILGRLIQHISGEDRIMVSGSGGPVNLAWQESTTSVSGLSFFNNSTAAYTTSTTGRIVTADTVSGAPLRRCNFVSTTQCVPDPVTGAFLATPIYLSRDATKNIFGVVRQMKMSCIRYASAGTLTQNGLTVGRYIGARPDAVGDTLVLTQTP